jgi:hypothetical protein
MNQKPIQAGLHEILGIKKEAFNAIMRVLAEIHEDKGRDALLILAALDEEQRSFLVNYWKNLWGTEYAKDEVKDYGPDGSKVKKVEAGAMEAGVRRLASLSSEDKTLIKSYWDNFYGSGYAKDMVKNYKQEGSQTQKVEASTLGLDPVTAGQLSEMDDEQLSNFLDSIQDK